MILSEPEFSLIKPGKKYNAKDDQGKYNGHHQPAQPDTIGISLV